MCSYTNARAGAAAGMASVARDSANGASRESGFHSQSGLSASCHDTVANITACLGIRARASRRALWRLSESEHPQRALLEKAITVTSGSGAVIRFFVEMALTPAEREKGLMFRRSLAAIQACSLCFRGPKLLISG
jgi:hypothetical protein